jgi:hypothetical protein
MWSTLFHVFTAIKCNRELCFVIAGSFRKMKTFRFEGTIGASTVSLDLECMETKEHGILWYIFLFNSSTKISQVDGM